MIACENILCTKVDVQPNQVKHPWKMKLSSELKFTSVHLCFPFESIAELVQMDSRRKPQAQKGFGIAFGVQTTKGEHQRTLVKELK